MIDKPATNPATERKWWGVLFGALLLLGIRAAFLHQGWPAFGDGFFCAISLVHCGQRK